jgi:hypothetical protein
MLLNHLILLNNIEIMVVQNKEGHPFEIYIPTIPNMCTIPNYIPYGPKFSPFHLYSWAKEENLHPYIKTYILGSFQFQIFGLFLMMGQSN